MRSPGLPRPLTAVRDGLQHRLRWREKTARIFDLELEAKTAEVREALWLAKGRQRRHDMVNAFMAVEGASIVLARESLTASDRSTLNAVLESGMQRLRAMILHDPGTDTGTASLAEVAEALADDTAWQDRLQLAVEPDLVAAGSPFETTEAARQLLSYCSDRSPVAPLTIRGARDGDCVVLWVEDRGQEISQRGQRAVREPNRWPSGSGAVTGLHVAIRLVHQLGGAVHLQPRRGGGMSFGICLPAAGNGRAVTPPPAGA